MPPGSATRCTNHNQPTPGGSREEGRDAPSSFLITLQLYNNYKKRHIRDILAERIFLGHTYDTSMMIIVTKPGIIIDVVGSYFCDKKS